MSLKVSAFVDVRLKSFNIVEPEGKKPFYFVEFVDGQTFNSTGQMMFNAPQGFKTDDIVALKQLELQPVTAELEISSYQNRASLRCLSISPRNTNNK